MKTLNTYLESLLDDEDVLSDPKRDRIIVENWIKENYTVNDALKINDVFVVSCKGSVVVKNKNITSLTNGMFRWGEVGGGFYCCNCGKLASLEGSPRGVGENFNCTGCHNLKSLIGAPEEVGGDFSCYGCKNLTSLKGSPKVVGGGFNCSHCDNIKTLDCASAKINSYFSCIFCKNLKTLKGGPKYVKNDFYCSDCSDLVITDSDYKKYKIRP